MIDKHVFLFSVASSNMVHIVRHCWAHGIMSPDQPVWSADQKELKDSRDVLMTLRRALILSEMDGPIPQLDRVARSASDAVNVRDFQKDVENLQKRILDDLYNEFYFHLDQRDVPYYQTKDIFGPKVAAKFRKASEDIEEAGKCIALQRPTASVFHLMRAMEVVVQRLGKKLGVANVDKEWGKILSDIGRAIEAMPKYTETEKRKRARWSEANANLYHVKQAWRNETMHPKQTYTRDQALEVFQATRVFMNHLAGLL